MNLNKKSKIQESIKIKSFKIFENETTENSNDTNVAKTTKSNDTNNNANNDANKNNANKNNTNDNKINLDKKEIEKKIKLIRNKINNAGKEFEKTMELLKKKFSNNEGKISKKLEVMILLKTKEINDYIYQKWEEFYNNVGDKKSIQEIQKKRAEISKEIKNGTEELKKLIEQKDKEKIKYKVGKTYEYETSTGDKTTIKIKEVDENGNVFKAINQKGNEINPYTDRIGNIVKK